MGTATTVLWPTFRIYAETSIVDTWLELTCKSQVLLHALLAGHASMAGWPLPGVRLLGLIAST